jgi:hypothetical protein
MASGGTDCKDRALDAFQPISEMLDVGECEPLKAAVHGVLLATVTVCAAYNAAAWLKRRQPHLAFNTVVYGIAMWWEHTHVQHHLVACAPATGARLVEPESLAGARATQPRLARKAAERDAA